MPTFSRPNLAMKRRRAVSHVGETLRACFQAQAQPIAEGRELNMR
jgi:hypothetical protein